MLTIDPNSEIHTQKFPNYKFPNATSLIPQEQEQLQSEEKKKKKPYFLVSYTSAYTYAYKETLPN